MQHQNLVLLDFVDAMCRNTLKVASALPPAPLPPAARPSRLSPFTSPPPFRARARALSLSVCLSLFLGVFLLVQLSEGWYEIRDS
jgi:hypothetical protein